MAAWPGGGRRPATTCPANFTEPSTRCYTATRPHILHLTADGPLRHAWHPLETTCETISLSCPWRDPSLLADHRQPVHLHPPHHRRHRGPRPGSEPASSWRTRSSISVSDCRSG